MNHLITLDKDSKRTYFAVKERYGEQLADRTAFISEVTARLKAPLLAFDTIVIPESSNDFIFRVASGLEKPVIVVYKSTKEQILEKVDTLPLQKMEKESHLKRINEMKNGFIIRDMKANQRVLYESFLFQRTTVPENSVLLDDSCFSGTTFRALEKATSCKNCFAIFSFADTV